MNFNAEDTACFADDKPKEECGVFGVYRNTRGNVATDCYFGLYALQHRGQESCGIVVNNDGVFKYKKGMGLVGDVFKQPELSALGSGKIALGHVRYSTTGLSTPHNTQPLVIRHMKGPMAVSHNGNLVNAVQLRKTYESRGGIFHSTSDTEAIAYAITQERLVRNSIEEAVESALPGLHGAFCLVVMSAQKLIAARDPHGFHPLCIGELPGSSHGYVFSSESCALSAIGAKFVRDVLPGEIVIADDTGLRSITTHCPGSGTKSSVCVFEFIYFARPDSVIEGASVHRARRRAGKFLAQTHPVDADIVIGVPDSGIDAALGYSKESGIPYGIGFIKNRYIGRTFIQPTQNLREASVKIKLNVIADTVKDKRVIMIDDSIVRGTTTGVIVKLLREAGAREVHVRISAPPFMHPCYFGTDIDSRDKLIACRLTVPEIAKELGADSLGYLELSHAPLLAKGAGCGFCDGCFSGRYPLEVPAEMPKDKFESQIRRG
ncbi:amidophosphoribosyltransferase [Clostridia bacterium]|nr:amidophosphoribosyltransferase [Clostridia bacterium]